MLLFIFSYQLKYAITSKARCNRIMGIWLFKIVLFGFKMSPRKVGWKFTTHIIVACVSILIRDRKRTSDVRERIFIATINHNTKNNNSGSLARNICFPLFDRLLCVAAVYGFAMCLLIMHCFHIPSVTKEIYLQGAYIQTCFQKRVTRIAKHQEFLLQHIFTSHYGRKVLKGRKFN